MNPKAIAVTLTLFVAAVGGAVAIGDTDALAADDSASTEGAVAVDTTYENETVTVTVARNGTAVEGAAVEVADTERVTDANGTVVVEDADVDDELTVEVESETFEAELTYSVSEGSLIVLEEEYEYETEVDEDEDEDEDEHEDEDGR